VEVAYTSDLRVAQPITFETMRVAREFARPEVTVEQFYTTYEEESPALPTGMQKTRNLDRSILDVIPFKNGRKLALVRDILDRLYESTEAEYLVYTNVDIALMPYFYLAVNRLIDNGNDALVINRRTIDAQGCGLDELPLLFAQIGRPHPGSDCFVFKRGAYPRFELGTAFIGSGRIGLILAANLYYNSESFRQLKHHHLTFHIGDEMAWQAEDLDEERAHNDAELKKILKHYDFFRNPPDDPIIERLRRVYEPRGGHTRTGRTLRRIPGAARLLDALRSRHGVGT
jgi:hypothetical protein